MATYSLGIERALALGPLSVTTAAAPDFVQEILGDSSATRHVITANAQYYVMAERDARFRDCVAGAEFVCADGISLVLACKLLTGRSVERIAGVDLIPALCAEAADRGLSVYFLGGKPGMAAESAIRLMRQFPKLQVAGIACPPVGFFKDSQQLDQVLTSIRRAKPSILFVALGVPLQDYFIECCIRPLGVPVALGIGGSFEMIAGAVRRAPRWVQRCGFEWLFRWMQEPRRLCSRYLVGNTLFCYYVVKRLLKNRVSGIELPDAVSDFEQERG